VRLQNRGCFDFPDSLRRYLLGNWASGLGLPGNQPKDEGLGETGLLFVMPNDCLIRPAAAAAAAAAAQESSKMQRPSGSVIISADAAEVYSASAAGDAAGAIVLASKQQQP
jgi:hypothetical protein